MLDHIRFIFKENISQSLTTLIIHKSNTIAHEAVSRVMQGRIIANQIKPNQSLSLFRETTVPEEAEHFGYC